MASLDEICCGPLTLLILFFGVPMLLAYVRVILQYQSGVVFRLGRLQGIRGPGLTILIPFLDTLQIIDRRVQSLDIPKQEMLTRDNISVFLNAVVYFKINDPGTAVTKVQDWRNAIFQHGQAAMREVAGSVELDALLSERERIGAMIQKLVVDETKAWGIEVVSINIQDIELPEDMKRAMARQAQAERDKRATIIISLGEVEAAETLAKAARAIATTPGALHLRTLQALSNLSADKTNTITYLLPIEGQDLTFGREDMPEPSVSVGKKK
jgi:regulator of protease activity HflC (stomatin/prohibitin superfamily)